jgi:hypothetical protein
MTGLRWAPVNGPNGGGYGYEAGLVSESRPLPVTIPAHGAILLQLDVTQPACPNFPKVGTTPTVVGLPIRWSGLGVHHIWQLQLLPDQLNQPITLCPSAVALAHIPR